VPQDSFKKLFSFLVVKGCLDESENVAAAFLDAAETVIQMKGQDCADEILKILEKFIQDGSKHSELSKNQAVILIGSLARYLDNTSQKKLTGTFEKMLELLNAPSDMIRRSICRCIPQLAKFFEDRSRKFLADHMEVLLKSTEEKLVQGSAYAVAGIVKGLGIKTLQQESILDRIEKGCFGKHAEPLRKISGILLFEALVFSLGKSFEMYIDRILPFIMQAISDVKDQVRKTAVHSVKRIMPQLSMYAIKRVLPIFLQGLENDNWRSKLASVEALGNMAFCAPKQMSMFLPEIVKGIREVLNDTHEKVHEAAIEAIHNIGSVVKNPEIGDILEQLIKALSNTNKFLNDALKTLLDTSFVHAIDAPALSLLVPILDAGLMMHDNQSKMMASKLMGNICQLTQDPHDLLPYMKILMPAIKNSLFD